MHISHFFLLLSLSLLVACNSENTGSRTSPQDEAPPPSHSYATTGSIDRLSPAMADLIPSEATIEIIAEGFDWVEGPVWVAEHDMLLFSDIPPNKVLKWTEAAGLELYLQPSGFTGNSDYSNEPGSNGLLIDAEGRLVLCQHGDRRMARMDAPLDQPASNFVTLVDNWQGKRLNSPNDAVFDRQGNLFFTDPPYGLAQQEKDPGKEIPFQGVFFQSAESEELSLLTDEFSRPNGIALSPDEKTLYVANSDPGRAIWMAYDWDSGEISNGRIFYDVTEKTATEKGLPDGLKVDKKGNVWATGPGGVWIFSPEGEHLGSIKTGQATSNCAFNDDESVLYMTAHMYLLRVRLK